MPQNFNFKVVAKEKHFFSHRIYIFSVPNPLSHAEDNNVMAMGLKNNSMQAFKTRQRLMSEARQFKPSNKKSSLVTNKACGI